MDKKVLVFGFILLLQAFGPLLAQTIDPDPDPPGILQRLAERAREAKDTVKSVGRTVLGFTGAYYEDHIQPVAASYFERASSWKRSLWETMQTTIENYSPFTAVSSSDASNKK